MSAVAHSVKAWGGVEKPGNDSGARYCSLYRFSVVTSRIDKLALQLRKSAPALYSEYKTARKVLNQPGGESATPELSVTPEVKKAA